MSPHQEADGVSRSPSAFTPAPPHTGFVLDQRNSSADWGASEADGDICITNSPNSPTTPSPCLLPPPAGTTRARAQAGQELPPTQTRSEEVHHLSDVASQSIVDVSVATFLREKSIGLHDSAPPAGSPWPPPRLCGC